MKQKLLLKTMLLLCALIAGSGTTWAVDDVTATLTGSSMVTGTSTSYTDYTSTGVTDNDGNVWHGRWCYQKNGSDILEMVQLRTYTNSTDNGNCSRLNVPTFSGIIKTIELSITDGSATAYNTGSGSTTTMYLATAYSKTSVTAILTNSSSSTRKTVTFNLATLDDDYTGEGLYILANGGVRIWSVAVTYTPSSAVDLGADDFKYSAASFTANIGESNSFPTLTNTHSLPVTYQSTEESVATINSSGEITLVDEGTTTIKAVFAGNSSYKAKTVSYVLTVVNPSLTTIWSEDFSSYSANDVPKDGTYSYSCTNGSGNTRVMEDNAAGGTSPELLVGNTNGTFTAIIPLMTSTYGYSGDLTLRYKTNANSLNVKTTTDGITVDGEASTGAGKTFNTKETHKIKFKGITPLTESITIVFTATSSSNVRLDDIELKGAQAALTKAATPVITPASGAVVSGTEITMTCLTDGVTIYYTTDGSTPTSSSTAYNPSSKPTITAATTIKAIAIKDGLTDSDVATATYTLAVPCATPTFSVAAGAVAKGTTVTISTETDGATIYYTTDGSTPTTSSSTYSSAVTINSAMTIKAIAVKDGMANSEVASAAYTIIDYATLPFNWDNSTTPTGVTNSGVGTYSASPYLKFDGTGDYIVLKINEAPGTLTFDIQGNGFSGGTFKVQTSTDGSSYTDLVTYTALGTVKTEVFNSLSASVRYIKWIYTTKSSGNVALGNINLYTNDVVKVKLAASGYASFCSSYPLLLTPTAEYAAYAVTATSGSTVTFSKITGAVPAATPFILYGEGLGGTFIDLPVTTAATTPVDGNMLEGTLVPTAITTVNGEYTNFGLSGGKFVKINDGTLPANKAYLPILTANLPSGGGASEFTFVFDDEDGETTGVNEVRGQKEDVRGEFYNLNGQRVDQPTKGLYIVNGKKVIIK